ncbi:MAG: SDR family oxidoreductase [Oscillospiraceae bacterium]|nr:SDR family oxidoreductase [Oscillospiraceae bacterium]
MFKTVPPISSMQDAFSVKGLNVVVTGGNRGIGRGIAQAFAEGGANVAILCRNEASGQKAAEELKQHGGKYAAFRCDISVYDEVKAAVEQVYAFFDHVDVLINNAGVATTTPFLAPDGLEEWHRVIDVNLHGTASMIHEIAPKMVEAGKGGSIINITSVGAVRVSNTVKGHHNAPYNASKAGVDILTRYLAIVLGDAGIRVNSIQPGMTHSDLDKDLPEEAKAEAVSSVPAHRFGEPLEIGALCVYLASPAGSQVRGVNYAHDGGLMCIN